MQQVGEIERKDEEPKCGNCSKAESVVIKGEATGFVRCELRKRYEWLAARMPCQFNPVRWSR